MGRILAKILLAIVVSVAAIAMAVSLAPYILFGFFAWMLVKSHLTKEKLRRQVRSQRPVNITPRAPAR